MHDTEPTDVQDIDAEIPPELLNTKPLEESEILPDEGDQEAETNE